MWSIKCAVDMQCVQQCGVWRGAAAAVPGLQPEGAGPRLHPPKGLCQAILIPNFSIVES